ncbi:hypothetical protein UFOVP1_64 [uncultured Caudovirales phage]|uniref:Uncharacterized protein n=1 Tax=uncultured Caudovirales phage TaxID=2100421 RepID=A0A6J5KL85_9CAUD|nr:hypothetical protein UFOVP1_64 [uncultured Caudovirales phage]
MKLVSNVPTIKPTKLTCEEVLTDFTGRLDKEMKEEHVICNALIIYCTGDNNFAYQLLDANSIGEVIGVFSAVQYSLLREIYGECL